MQFFIYFIGILCSSTLFALGISNEFIPFGSAILGFSGLSLLYILLLKCKTYKQGALVYALHTVVVHLISSFWLAFFEDFAIFTLGGTTLAYFFFAIPFGIAFIFVLKKKTPLRIFLFASLWLAWEFFKSNDFLAYPWGTVPMFCFNLKHFIQFIDTTGVWGLSFIVHLISASIAEIINAYTNSTNLQTFTKKLQPFHKPFYFILGLIIILNLYGIYIFSKKVLPKTALNTIIVQQNADPWDMAHLEKYLQQSQDLTREAITASNEKPDLVVWSESSLPTSYPLNRPFYNFIPENDPFLKFLKEINTDILVGTPSKGKNNEFYNSSCLIDPNGEIKAMYSKMKLVAFAEYMPLSDNPIVKKLFNALVGFSSGYTPGKEYTLFSVKNYNNVPIKFTTPVCFEDAFPDQCIALHNLGSELLINITNDSWSKTNSAEYQHFIVAYFRAIELRTSLIRSTNSGFSVVIDPYGNILQSLPLFKEASMLVKVPIYEHTKTPFSIFKNWFPTIIFISLIKLMLSNWIIDIKKRASRPLPSSHWKETKKHKKNIRYYKPFFAVKRKKKK